MVEKLKLLDTGMFMYVGGLSLTACQMLTKLLPHSHLLNRRGRESKVEKLLAWDKDKITHPWPSWAKQTRHGEYSSNLLPIKNGAAWWETKTKLKPPSSRSSALLLHLPFFHFLPPSWTAQWGGGCHQFTVLQPLLPFHTFFLPSCLPHRIQFFTNCSSVVVPTRFSA